MGKNSLITVKEVPHIQGLAIILGCKVENLPTTYLGMPLGSKHKAFGYMEWNSGKSRKKIIKMEGLVFILGG